MNKDYYYCYYNSIYVNVDVKKNYAQTQSHLAVL